MSVLDSSNDIPLSFPFTEILFSNNIDYINFFVNKLSNPKSICNENKLNTRGWFEVEFVSSDYNKD